MNRPAQPCRSGQSRRSAAKSAQVRLAWLLAAALFGAAVAQGAPSITLDSFLYRVGDSVVLRAASLEPNQPHDITLTPPPELGAAVVRVVRFSSANGMLTFAAPLTVPGRWTVELLGPNIDARLSVQVNPVEAAEPGVTPEVTPPGTPADGAATPPNETEAVQEPAPEAEGPPVGQPSAPPVTPPSEAPGQTPTEAPTETPGEAPAETPSEAPGAQTTQSPAGAPQGTPEETQETREQPATATGEPQPVPVPSVAIDGGDVVGILGGSGLWRLSFPAGSGATSGLLQRAEVAYVGHGNHLLVLEAGSGNVLRRHRLPAQIETITEAAAPAGQAGSTALSVTVRAAAGELAAYRVTDDGPDGAFVFDPDPALYRWLRAEAEVLDPAARLLVDPTNPWLYLAAARLEPQRSTALLRAGMARAETFYEHAQLARELMLQPDRRTDLAAESMDAALEDFVARGYRGTLLFDEGLSEAYGFPLGAMRTALARSDAGAADFWAPWLYRLSSASVPATEEVLSRYAAELRLQGRLDEANTWAERSREDRRFDLAAALRRGAVAVGNTGWYGVAALLVAILALKLTLIAKYWRPQSLVLQQRRQAGAKVGPVPRLYATRYGSLPEKLVLVLLFAAAMALAALNGWAARSASLPSAWGSGSLASAAATTSLASNLDESAEALFLSAFAAQVGGDLATAAAAYGQLPDDADAMNNLGVLRGDDELFRRALEIRPRHPEASFNLGQAANPSRLLAAYRPDQPLLAAPGQQTLSHALAGGFPAAIGQAFTNPWAALTGNPAFSPDWLWTVGVILFLAWAVWTVVLLITPRPAAARNAPRTFSYHLCALLFPGTGLADEFWGLLLLIPWAIFGTDLLFRLLPLGVAPTMSLTTDTIALVVIYTINLVAFVVEFGSYRRRMTELRQNQPEVARAYGMRVGDAPPV